MGSRIWLPATAAAVLLTVSNCSSNSDNSTGERADGDEPADGTCWAVPADDVATPDYWFDDSPTVPCTEAHTTETAEVLDLTKPTVAEAEKSADACWAAVHNYLGVNLQNWVPWSFAMFLPSREQIADGASWMRCDAVFPTDLALSSVRTTTSPAEDAAIDPPPDFWACLDEHPKKSKQPFVPCDQPHQYEQTGTLAHLTSLEEYPSPTELAATARRQCAYAFQGEDTNLALTAAWDPRSVLQHSSEIAGACFMSNKTGQPLPPRP